MEFKGQYVESTEGPESVGSGVVLEEITLHVIHPGKAREINHPGVRVAITISEYSDLLIRKGHVEGGLILAENGH